MKSSHPLDYSENWITPRMGKKRVCASQLKIPLAWWSLIDKRGQEHLRNINRKSKKRRRQ